MRKSDVFGKILVFLSETIEGFVDGIGGRDHALIPIQIIDCLQFACRICEPRDDEMAE